MRNDMKFQQVKSMKGTLTVPGDKSISHRAIMLGAIAKGTTEIHGFLQSADCLSTISCFQSMGVDITQNKNIIRVAGKGMHQLKAAPSSLNVGNSGTTIRLLSGILCAQPFQSTISGDSSIEKRPMQRIIDPLSKMGAKISSVANNSCAPLSIRPSKLYGMEYHSPTASAQVKSSILLAGLYADGKTTVYEPYISRNHSEIMLSAFGAKIERNENHVTISPTDELYAQKIIVPGDISSAAYFIVAGLLVPNSELLIKNVGINETRDGIIKVVKQMGGNISLQNIHTTCGETVADIYVQTSNLHGITIEGSIIPTLIDELPIIAILASQASGTTIIKDAAELKVKECNRIDAVSKNLNNMGANVTPTEDGFIIEGSTPLHGTDIHSYKDHRIAMSFTIAALIASGETTIQGSDCVTISYPSFYEDVNSLINKL